MKQRQTGLPNEMRNLRSSKILGVEANIDIPPFRRRIPTIDRARITFISALEASQDELKVFRLQHRSIQSSSNPDDTLPNPNIKRLCFQSNVLLDALATFLETMTRDGLTTESNQLKQSAKQVISQIDFLKIAQPFGRQALASSSKTCKNVNTQSRY